SELKSRIAAGEVAEVRIGTRVIEAVPVDSIQASSDIQVWQANLLPYEDPELIPLLEESAVPYEGVLESWLAQAFVWMRPLGLIVLFWIWMLRRMNPTQGVLTVGKSRAKIVGEEGTGI